MLARELHQGDWLKGSFSSLKTDFFYAGLCKYQKLKISGRSPVTSEIPSMPKFWLVGFFAELEQDSP